jgi:hypothetical protein
MQAYIRWRMKYALRKNDINIIEEDLEKTPEKPWKSLFST